MIILLLNLLGCIALCLYGMKVMSQGLLQLTGSRVRATLRNVSQNRFYSYWVGAEVTFLVQSSAAVTMMAVSSVNAGLMSLHQSVALIMGANVGTTLIAWLLSLVGYACPAGKLAIPLIVLALPFIYSRRIKAKPWGATLMGVALTVFGFCTLISLMPNKDVGGYPSLAAVFEHMEEAMFWSVPLFAVIGIVVTILLRSSVATILISMVLCASGWLSLPLTASVVIGSNVGTTIMPVWASRKANVSARRSAFAHLFFNLIGLLWALPMVCLLSGWIQSMSDSSAVSLACGVALIHTGFNLVTALMLIGFVPGICRFLSRLFPVQNDDEEEFHLSFIQGGFLSTAELSVDQARKETVQFGLRCQRMFDLTSRFIQLDDHDESFNHLFTRIEKYEKITDRLEMEIDRYLNGLDKSEISPRASVRIRSIFQMADELESVGDACENLARAVVRRHEAGVSFIQMQQNNISRMLDLTRADVDLMIHLMNKNDLTSADMNRAYNLEDEVNSFRNQLRDQNIGNVQSGYYTYQSGVLYMELISGCEKLCDYIINVIEALASQNDIPAREEE